MKNITLLIFILIALISCNKEKSANPCTDNSLIRQVKVGDQAQQRFTYNGNCMITESIEPFRYVKYSYDNSNRLVKQEEALSLDPSSCFMPVGADPSVTDPRKAKVSYYNVYGYDSTGQLKSKSRYFINDQTELIYVTRYEYTSNRISKSSNYNPDNSLTMYHSFTYDDAGNMIRDDYFFIFSLNEVRLESSVEYEFDNKINPFSILKNSGDPGINTNPNNIVKETYTYYDSGNTTSHSNEYQYEYNPAGYPVKVNERIYSYGN